MKHSTIVISKLNPLKCKFYFYFLDNETLCFKIGCNLGFPFFNCLSTVCLFYTLKYGKGSEQQGDITKVILFQKNNFCFLTDPLKYCY